MTKDKAAREDTCRDSSGDLQALKARVWHGVVSAHAMLRARSNDDRLRAIHALSQASSAYLRVVEAADLERELVELKEQVRVHTEQLEADRRREMAS